MKAALETVSTDGSSLDIRFFPVEPVELEDIGDGHLTACLLHTERRHRTWAPQPSADQQQPNGGEPEQPEYQELEYPLIEPAPDANADGRHHGHGEDGP